MLIFVRNFICCLLLWHTNHVGYCDVGGQITSGFRPSPKLKQNGQLSTFEFFNANQIQTLLKSGKATHSDFSSFEELADIPNLTKLVFPYGTELNRKEIHNIAQIERLRAIEMGFPAIDSEFIIVQGSLDLLRHLKNMESFVLNKDLIEDDDLKFIAYLPKLQHLEFSADNGLNKGTKCTDKVAKYLVHAKSLRTLTIYGGDFSDDFILSISKGLPKLETLKISSPKLTDYSLKFIALYCKNLKHLRISSENFTPSGEKYLSAIDSLEKMRITSPAIGKK